MLLPFLGSLGAIVLVDLALSGDNALIIGAAASGLEKRQRMMAIIAGGGAAIVLRITFAIAATLLLQIPLLEAIGGGILLVIAVRLLIGREEHVSSDGNSEAGSPSKTPKRAVSFGAAMLTILVADVTMSLDNILAVGGLAHGDLPLLAVGLLISVALLLVGSAIVASLIGRLPWLLDLAALVLGWTAGSMVFHDGIIGPYLSGLPFGQYLVPAIGAALVLAIDVFIRWREKRETVSRPEPIEPVEQEPVNPAEMR
jgi:YjbE family integral membrane protein